jgi:glutathione synthase/RimK-type ligase-like ATP-grasp enzyme
MSAVEDWVEKIGTFPIVAKLKAGSGASNVVLIKTQQQLYRYAKRMFGRGYSGKPSAFFKIKSNVSSSRTLDDFISRFKRAPEFIFSRMYAASREREHGYVYLQEFIPNVDYDLKVVVIGDKLSFIGRSVRKDDFRASGGGDLFYNRDLMTEELIKTAFHAADALQSDCIGLDMISNPITFKPLILEISYGFSHTALLAANGHYDRNAVWHEEPLNAPRALLDMLIRKLRLL